MLFPLSQAPPLFPLSFISPEFSEIHIAFSASSMAPVIFFYAECDDHHCRLESKSPNRDSCFMCDKPLGRSADIYMYRGNTPFCSTECREEQIEMDDAEERRRRKRSIYRNKSETIKSTVANKSTGTIQVA